MPILSKSFVSVNGDTLGLNSLNTNVTLKGATSNSLNEQCSVTEYFSLITSLVTLNLQLRKFVSVYSFACFFSSL